MQPPRASIPTICQASKMSSFDIRSLGITRSMDLYQYVLYSGDEKFVHDMVSRVTNEAADEDECEELRSVFTTYQDRPLMCKCLFFLMIYSQPKFRYWSLDPKNGVELLPICPYKAIRFLQILRDDLVPRFLVNETLRLDDFERELKVEYNRS